MPDVRRVGVDAAHQRAPQVRLPVQVVVEVAGVAVDPVDEQLRALPGIRREQSGDPPRHRVAPPLPEFLLLALLEVAEVGGQRRAPRLVEAGVDDLEQRPDHRIRVPWILVGGAGDLRDERAWVAECDAGADAVGGLAAAEDVRQPLAQPPLHAARRDQHQLLGERVGQRVGK